MIDGESSRREFLKAGAVAAGAAVIGAKATGGEEASSKLRLATNVYPWITFYRREGKDFNAALDAGLGEIAAAGLDGFEPIANSPQHVDEMAPLLKKHGIQMRSLYVNTLLHEADKAEESIAQVLAIAERARRIGTRIIVTNPSPIRWGGPENKDDAQLRTQAKALDKLGEKLADMGVVLSYHNHDIELRNAAREFHHMMVATDPKHVTLCLDAHWIYRGAGNSAVAVFDVLKLYGPRITELHLRQSVDGVWTEAFGPGDLDYPAIARHLLAIKVKPHIVLEQAVEQDTPNTMTAVEAHRKGAAYARKVFAAFAG